MKKLLGLLLALGALHAGAQNNSTISETVNAKKILQVHGRKINGITNDVSMPDDTAKVPTAAAVHAYVLAHAGTNYFTAHGNDIVNNNTGQVEIDSIYVDGYLKYSDGNAGAGKVLTSNASGVATWQTPAGGTSAPSNEILYGTGTGTASNSNFYFDGTTFVNGAGGIVGAGPLGGSEVDLSDGIFKYANPELPFSFFYFIDLNSNTFSLPLLEAGNTFPITSINGNKADSAGRVTLIPIVNSGRIPFGGGGDKMTSSDSLKYNLDSLNVVSTFLNKIETVGRTILGDSANGTYIEISGSASANAINYNSVNGHNFNSKVDISSGINVRGKVALNYTHIFTVPSEFYLLSDSEYVAAVDNGAYDATIYLPDASVNVNRIIIIKRYDYTSTGDIIILCPGYEVQNQMSGTFFSYTTLNAAWGTYGHSLTFQSNGTHWEVIN